MLRPKADLNLSTIPRSLLDVCGIFLSCAVLSAGVWLNANLMGYKTFPVYKSLCTCTCWDGKFKGSQPRGRYKHVFFNFEPNVFFMFAGVCICASLLKDFLLLMYSLYSLHRLRFRVLVVVVATCHSHFYGAWALFNYLNESSDMLLSQMFFSSSELLSTLFLVRLCDKTIPWSADALWPPLAISLTHILCALADGILFGLFDQSTLTNNARDVMLMFPDFLIVASSLYWLHSLPRGVHSRAQAKCAVAVVTMFLFYYWLLRVPASSRDAESNELDDLMSLMRDAERARSKTGF